MLIVLLAMFPQLTASAYVDGFAAACKVVWTTFVKGNTQLALQMQHTVPNTVEGWIKRFDAKGVSAAPGGGDAFGAETDGTTGRIGVSVTGEFPYQDVTLTRPQYADQESRTLTINGPYERIVIPDCDGNRP
jgi:hypothetical protein|tara:strand:- start:1462 stop:1857 length:396 start_codon:yes stop_codon:yes gene_type:complete